MNRVLKYAALEAHRASITIAAGGGRRPEPVVRRPHNNPNPVGVEQFSDVKKGAIYSTPTGSMKLDMLSNHGFRFTSPAAIIIMTPMGVGYERRRRMNRAQKNAWFGLVNCLLAIAFCCFFFYRAFFYIPAPGFRFAPQPSQVEMIVKTILHLWPLALPVIALILLLIPRKKQSPAEPDFDELDAAIQNKATRVAFVSVWLLWLLVLILIMLMVAKTTPLVALVSFCFFVSTAVFVVCMGIYFLTKVILYKKQTEGGAA